MQKKILIEGMSGNMGGVETFIHLLYSCLKDDYQVDFLVQDNPIPFQEEFLENGCNIYRVTPRSHNFTKNKKDIESVFKNGNYDVFWSNKTTLSNVASLIMAKKYNVQKIICHSHQSKNMGNTFTAFMHNLNKKRVSKYTDVNVACSDSAARYFFDNIKDVVYLNNAVDVKKYEPNKEKRSIMRERFGISDDCLCIGLVAQFRHEKNHAFLIDVFNELTKLTSAKLILCGEGPYEEEIYQKVQQLGLASRVLFLGRRSDIPDIMQAIDIFVMPSLFEGLPFALVEAQAAGIPCLVSDTVSKDCKLSNLVYFNSLQEAPRCWADEIVKLKLDEKICPMQQLEEKGFTYTSFAVSIKDILSS